MTLSREQKKIRIQFNWSIELYGLGHAIRELIKYPKLLPIFAFSDHGVTFWEDIPEEFESPNNKGKTYYSWNPTTVRIRSFKNGLNVVGVKHPWVTYRSRRGYEIQASATGTLYFPFHHAPGYTFSGYSDEEAVSNLRSLPLEFHPIHISLHHHDLGSERHKFYMSQGFHVISAGNGTSQDFMDNFYKNAIGYKRAISQGVGSQIFFLVELGIPVQVYPIIPIVIDNQTGKHIVTDEGHKEHERIQELFSDPPLHITREQREIVEHYLGFEFPSIQVFRVQIYKLAIFVGIPWICKKLILIFSNKFVKFFQTKQFL
jgi:hypothetical protein